jgi:histidinol phosphatase-like enzyme
MHRHSRLCECALFTTEKLLELSLICILCTSILQHRRTANRKPVDKMLEELSETLPATIFAMYKIGDQVSCGIFRTIYVIKLMNTVSILLQCIHR